VQFKFKYKEAAPTPEGMDDKAWDQLYTAADSRIYNHQHKRWKMSAQARASGETRALALKIIEERKEKAQEKAAKSTASTTKSVASTSTVSKDKESITSQTEKPVEAEATSSTNMDPPHVKVPVRRGNKALKVESSSSRSATPDPQSDHTGSVKPSTIADKVKGKSRATRKKQVTQESPSQQQPPSEFFGRQDPKDPQPFGFNDQSVPELDPKHPFRGKDSLPTARQEFNELNSTFKNMTMGWEDNFDRDASIEVNARDTNDFDPDEKIESGPGKRYAGFEPFVRGSPISPVASRSNTPIPKEVAKGSKKKTNRGQKKKTAAAKKKAAAKDEKAKDDKGKGKSVEPEEDDEASEGASSNDGGEYCICRGPDDHRPMIACDNCDEWYHCSCVDFKESDVLLIDKYICQKCDIPGTHFTTWKPMCRLPGCRKPCDLSKPSKYCCPEHKAKYWDEAIQRAPDGPGPSRGGAITKGELKSLLEHTKGDVKAFHALGTKPTLPTPPELIDWNKILTEEEKGRLCQITADKMVLNTRSIGFKDKEKLVRMAMDRLQKAIDARKDLAGVCGWDARLAMNEEEFQIWRNSPAGMKAFETSNLDGTMCEKKRCPRHGAWIKTTITECRLEDNLVHKQLSKLRSEEHAIKDRANTRAAAQL
jgi:hypothetical protein